MDKVYIDCNIILDWIIDRPPFSIYAIELIDLIEKKQVQGFISPLIQANCRYIIYKKINDKTADQFLLDSIRLFKILDNTGKQAIKSIKNGYKDFEDDLHYNAALENKIDYLITRNKSDFKVNKIKIRTAEEYLEEIK